MDSAGPHRPGDGHVAPARAWFVVFIMFLMFVGAQIDRQIMAMVAQQMKHDLGFTDEQLGLLMGLAFSLTYAISAIFTGNLADRVDRKKLLSCGLVIWSLLTCLCGVVRSFPALFAARLGVGLGESVLSPTGLPLVASAFPEGKRSFPLAFTLAGSAVGLIVTPIVVGLILHASAGRLYGPFPLVGTLHGWQLTFLTAGAFGLLTLLLLPFVHQSRVPGETTARSTGLTAAFQHFGRYPAFYAATMLTVPVAVSSSHALISWMPSYMQRTFALGPAEAGFYNGIAFIPAAILSPVIAGYLGRWAEASRNVRRHFMVMVGLMPVLALLVALPMLAPTVEMCVVAFTLAITWTNILMLYGFIQIQQIVPNSYRSLATAVTFAGNVLIAAGLGPALVGTLATRVFGEQAIASGQIVLILVSMPAALWLAIAGTRTRRFPPDIPYATPVAAAVPGALPAGGAR